jgi:hypothetical protein
LDCGSNLPLELAAFASTLHLNLFQKIDLGARGAVEVPCNVSERAATIHHHPRSFALEPGYFDYFELEN